LWWKNWLTIYWTQGLQYQIFWYRSSIWCSWWLLRLYITWIDMWCSRGLLLRLWVDESVTDIISVVEILISFIWDSTLTKQYMTCYCIISCYRKLLRNDCLTITPCIVLLFIVYTVTDTVYCPDYCSQFMWLLLLLLYCYCHRVIPVF